MYKFLTKNGQAIAFIAGLVITGIFFLIALGGMEAFNALSKEDQYNSSIFDFGLYGAIAFTVIAALATLAFAILQIAGNIRNSVAGIIGILVLIGVFIVSYAMASGEVTGDIARAVENAGGISTNNLKLIGGGITTALILLGLATLTFVGSEIRNFFK